MKPILLASGLLLLFTESVFAQCSLADFEIQGFKPAVYDDCQGSPCPSLRLTGKIKNNCGTAAGAMLRIVALDKNGEVVDVVEAWPASTRNIAAGAQYPFNMGPLMKYRSEMKSFSVEAIDVRQWR